MNKQVLIDGKALKELKKFPRIVYLKFQALFEELEEKGKLEEPFAKKLAGVDNLFEVRVKYKGEWRALYTYVYQNQIMILSAFSKKTQKTALAEINKARERKRTYDQ